MKNTTKKIAFSSIAILLSSYNLCLAQGIVPTSHIEDGKYKLSDFTTLLLNVANWILTIVGSLALLAFIYGGVLFLISAGSNEKVNQAKQVIVGAVIGLVIVFASYTIVGFTLSSMDVKGAENWATAGWFKK